MSKRRTTCVIVLAVAATLSLGVAPAHAGATADSAVRISPSGDWLGGGVFSLDASGQTLVAKIPRGASQVFDVCIGHDAGVQTTVGIVSEGDRGKLLATWKDNLDSSVVDDATIGAGYSRPVPGGQSLCLTLKVKVKSTAKVGTSKTWSILGDLIGYTNDTDMAAITVTVKR